MFFIRLLRAPVAVSAVSSASVVCVPAICVLAFLQLDGVPVAAVNNSQVTSGVVGLLAEGSASGWFDNVVATTDCDFGFQCLGRCCRLVCSCVYSSGCLIVHVQLCWQALWWARFAHLDVLPGTFKPAGTHPGPVSTAVCGVGRTLCATCCHRSFPPDKCCTYSRYGCSW
jgi:hypothetical protein